MRRHAISNASRRLAGQPRPAANASMRISRPCGFRSQPKSPFSRADCRKSEALPPGRRVSSKDTMSASRSGSRRSTVRVSSGDTARRRSRSPVPSQSAARHESRNRGRPSASRRRRISSSGVRGSPFPARTSSSPSMKSVFPDHGAARVPANARKSRAGRKSASAPSASTSRRNSVVLPAPGSPRSTSAPASRKAASGRDRSSPASVTVRGTRLISPAPPSARRVARKIPPGKCPPAPRGPCGSARSAAGTQRARGHSNGRVRS